MSWQPGQLVKYDFTPRLRILGKNAKGLCMLIRLRDGHGERPDRTPTNVWDILLCEPKSKFGFGSVHNVYIATEDEFEAL